MMAVVFKQHVSMAHSSKNRMFKHKILTREEERVLIKRYQEGDDIAGSELARHNLRFVDSVVSSYVSYSHEDFWDLFNVGVIGLMIAAKKFNLDTDYRFISYAVWWVRQQINKQIVTTTSTIRISQSEIQAIQRRNKESLLELTKSVDQEVAEKARVELRSNKGKGDFKVIALQYDYLDAPDNHGKSQDIQAEAFDLDAELSMADALDILLPDIPERELSILNDAFGLQSDHQMTLAEIGDKHNLTRERVRQLRNQALNRLQNIARKHKLTYSDC